jgi:hypothetical protein
MKMMNLLALALGLAAVLPIPGAQAKKVELSPTRSTVIESPTCSRDVRVLLLFELPPEVMSPKARVDFATLVCTAQVSGASIGQIDVFPMTTDWKNESTISWAGLWSKPGGDFETDSLFANYNLRSEAGAKTVAIDITPIVEGWRAGKIPNRGIVLKLSADDLATSSTVRYTADRGRVTLKIYYSFE